MEGFARVRRLGLSLPGATEQIQWEDHLLLKVGGKIFAILDASPSQGAPGRNVLSLKCSDDDFDRLTALPAMVPAPYLARARWVAFERFDALPPAELDALLERSYELVRAKLPAKVRATLALASALQVAAPADEEDVPSMFDLMREEEQERRQTASRAAPKKAPAKAAPKKAPAKAAAKKGAAKAAAKRGAAEKAPPKKGAAKAAPKKGAAKGRG